MKFLVLAMVMVVLGCGKNSSPEPGEPGAQTFGGAMALYCDAPNRIEGFEKTGMTKRLALLDQFVAEHIKEPKTLNVAAALQNANPSDRARELMRVATEEASLEQCPLALVSGPIVPGDPAVVGVALGPLNERPLVAVGPAAIRVEGETIVSIRDGRVESSELENGAQGYRIVKLGVFLDGLKRQGRAVPDKRINLYFDRNIPFSTAFRVIFTSIRADFTEPLLLVSDREGRLGTIPLAIPDSASGVEPIGLTNDDRTPARPPEETLQLVVSVTKNELVLWSFSGLEGTLAKPRLQTPLRSSEDQVGALDLDPLVASLAEIVKRRWAGKTRPKESLAIVVTIDPESSFGIAADVIASVRVGNDGSVLFSDVLLSAGFD